MHEIKVYLKLKLEHCRSIMCTSQCDTLGGQIGVAVTHPHGNDQDVGSNPATTRNEKRPSGDPLHRRWPKVLNRISVEDRRCKVELDL